MFNKMMMMFALY